MNDTAATKQWHIKAAGREFGPYTLDVLTAYASEGRITASATVRAEGETVWIAAIDDPLLRPLFDKRVARKAAVEASPSNFVIVASFRSVSIGAFERALAELGDVYRLNDTVWLLHGAQSLTGVRNRLVHNLGKTDTLVVIDSMTGKASWSNLGPEAEARLRTLWKRPPETAS